MDSLSSESLAKDADLRYTVDDLQKKFDAELQIMHRKSGGVRKGRFTLGDGVAQLPLSDKVQALLFVRVRGQVLTGNKKVFGTFVAGSRSDTAVMDFGLVDARTGDVLYFGKTKLTADVTQDSEEVAAGITRAFMGLPKASPFAPSAHQDVPGSTAGGAAIDSAESPKPPATALLPAANSVDSGSQPRRIRLSQGPLKGKLIRQVIPAYPRIAAAKDVHGEVEMGIVIDRNGRVIEVKDVSGPMELRPAAISAVKQWLFQPFTANGQVFEVETRVVLAFNLPQ